MKKTILTFGFVSGIFSSIMMAAAVPFSDRIGLDKGELLGYTFIVLSFLMVTFGIRSYRDNTCQGQINFGQAFVVGLSITLISCVCYVVTWEIIYYNFLPGFMDKYGAYLLQKAKASGGAHLPSSRNLNKIKKYKEIYANSFLNAAMTFLEPFPIGLVMTLISALTLKRKPKLRPATSPLLEVTS